MTYHTFQFLHNLGSEVVIKNVQYSNWNIDMKIVQKKFNLRYNLHI